MGISIMKKLSIIIVAAVALAQCKKDIQPLSVDHGMTLTTIFKGNNIDCKSCMSYADSIAHNGFVINPAVFCENYCKYVKRVK